MGTKQQTKRDSWQDQTVLPQKPRIDSNGGERRAVHMPGEIEYEFESGQMGIGIRAVGKTAVVSRVEPDRLAAKKGVRVGSVITAVNDKRMCSRQEVANAIKNSARPLRLSVLPPEDGGAAAREEVAAK